MPALPRSTRINRRSPGMRAMAATSGGAEHLEDGAGVLGPAGRLEAKLLSTLRRQLIKFRPSVVLGDSPLGLEPAPLFHAVEGGVERALFDVERVVGRV